MLSQTLVRYRLHPAATFMRDVGYIFIDLDGRLFRMNELDFEAFRARCEEGIDPSYVRAFRNLLIETASPTEAAASFQHQELATREH